MTEATEYAGRGVRTEFFGGVGVKPLPLDLDCYLLPS